MFRIAQTALLIALVSASFVAVSADDPPATQLLEKAIYQEQTVGDLPTALRMFQQIVAEYEQYEKVAAQAQLHIGLIHLKLGDPAQAATVIQGLADRFPGQQKFLHQRRLEMSPVIDETIEQIRANYVDEMVDDSDLTAAALRGVVGNLDGHSAYMDAQALKDLKINTSGRLVGIGAILDTLEGRLIVKAPLPGSPAREAGLIAGDTIVSIDGIQVAEVTDGTGLAESVKRIRGKAGAVVTIEIISAGSDKPRTVQITRREVKLDSVIGMSRDKNDVWQFRLSDHPKIGYMRIWGFTKETPHEFRRAVTQLASSGIRGLIIDLRDCSGGLMSSTIEIADMFLTEGVILDVRGRHQEKKTYAAGKDEILKDVSIAILVNRNTASAAEILVGALKDHERAIVIGERTYGKGTVQSLFPLQSGGAIKLTTARFYLPGGSSLEKPINPSDDDTWGVDPNEGFAVEMSDQEMQAYATYRAAIKTFGRPDGSQVDFKDRVLEKAVEYLKPQ